MGAAVGGFTPTGFGLGACTHPLTSETSAGPNPGRNPDPDPRLFQEGDPEQHPLMASPWPLIPPLTPHNDRRKGLETYHEWKMQHTFAAQQLLPPAGGAHPALDELGKRWSLPRLLAWNQA